MPQVNVLLVEDEAITAQEITLRLKKLGYGISAVARTGEEAVRTAEKCRPDLILMDILLKGKMNGIETVSRIRKKLNIPCICITAHSDTKMLKLIKKSEPAGYIAKPFRDDELVRVIENTLRKQAERKVNRLNRILTVVNKINRAVTHFQDVDSLFKQVSDIIVKDGGFLMAWIGVVDKKSRSVKVAALCGKTGNYLKGTAISTESVLAGGGLTSRAFREGKPCVCNDIARDKRMNSRRDQALKTGYRSFAAFPFKMEGQFKGVLNAYSSEIDFFDTDEIQLFDELAVSLSSAVERVEKEIEYNQAQETLIHKKEETQRYLDISGVMLIV